MMAVHGGEHSSIECDFGIVCRITPDLDEKISVARRVAKCVDDVGMILINVSDYRRVGAPNQGNKK